MSPSIFLKQLTFSGGESIDFEPDSIVVIVGPNNVGKSATLREILSLVQGNTSGTDVLTGMSVEHLGKTEDFLERLEPYRWPGTTSPQAKYRLDGFAGLMLPGEIKPAISRFSFPLERMDEEALRLFWESTSNFSRLDALFFYLLDLPTRFKATEPAKAINLATGIVDLPIQKMCADEALAQRLSRYFQRAFGQALVLNRTAGSRVPLHCGEVPPFEPGEDRVSPSYARKMDKLPLLQRQGDGMRSFAGCLLQVASVDKFVVLIDEPEAFLHPPQARFLGTLLAREKPAGRQLVIATHSGDLLRGLLDANPSALKVIRLTREGDVNHARSLDTDQIRALWDDPILRFSNTLDSLFHEQVVLCEADGDCRFYAALLDAVQPEDTNHRTPDVMFTSTGGKHKIPTIAGAMASIGVSTRAVVDFDVLNSDAPLRQAIEALGGSWDTFQARWKQVKSGVEKRRPELETTHVRAEIEKLLRQIDTPTFPSDTAKRIQELIKRTSPWEEAKRVGLDAVPAGQERQAAEKLLADLKQLGLFIVERGEMESFDPTVGRHGNAWVAAVLGKDLRHEPHLEHARRFVRELIPLPKHEG